MFLLCGIEKEKEYSDSIFYSAESPNLWKTSLAENTHSVFLKI